MYYYASKLTAAALSAGLRVSDSGNSGASIVCSCQEIKNGGECIGRSSPNSFRPLVNFTAQTLSGNSTQKIHSRLGRVSGSGVTGPIGSAGSENIFVTANVEHPRSTGYHRHRTKQKVRIQ